MTDSVGAVAAVRTPARSWFVLVGYALVCAANQMLWLSYAPVTTVAATRYGVSIGAIGWLAQIFPLLYVLLAVPAGLLLDHWFRPALAAGAALTAVGAAIRLGNGFGPALTGQILVAIAQPLVLNALTKTASSYLPARARPAGIALGSASVFAGMVLALGLGAVLPGAESLPLLLGISAGFAVVATVVLLIALTDRASQPATLPIKSPLRTVLKDPPIVRVILLGCFGFGVFVAVTTWLEALLAPFGISVGTAGILLLIMVVLGIAGSALLPVVLVRRHASMRFLRIAVPAAAAGLVLLAVRPGLVSAAIACALVGAALLTALPLLLDVIEQRAGEAGATASGLLWLGGNLGGLLVALAVQGLLGQPRWAFALLAAVLLVALPVAFSRHLRD